MHCVLIDFAAATQSVDELDAHATDDFYDCFDVLQEPEVGLGVDMIFEHFGNKEPWDKGGGSIIFGEETRFIMAPDLFPAVQHC